MYVAKVPLHLHIRTSSSPFIFHGGPYMPYGNHPFKAPSSSNGPPLKNISLLAFDACVSIRFFTCLRILIAIET